MEVFPFCTAASDQANAELAQQEAVEAARAQGRQLTMMLSVAAVLLVLLTTAVLLWVRSRRRAAREPVDLGDFVLEELATIVEDPETIALPTIEARPERDAVPALPDPSEEALDAERRRAQVNRLGATEPQKAAELLRGLMDERQPV
jgi:flagellar M-ring protein FliF